MADRLLLLPQIVDVLNAALDNPGVQQLWRVSFPSGEEWKIIMTYYAPPDEERFDVRIQRRDTLIG